VAQVVEKLPSMCEALNSNLSIIKNIKEKNERIILKKKKKPKNKD
jgi:hypothetical protein